MTRPARSFEEALGLLRDARTPADLFDESDPVASYRRLAKLVHPDLADGANLECATKAFVRLGEWWAAYRRRPSLTVAHHTYLLGGPIAAGDLADLTEVSTDDGTAALLKLARDPRDNDLLRREAAALRRLALAGEARHRVYVPRLLDRCTFRDRATGVDRAANILERFVGFHTLAEVASAYPGGLDARDAAWIWRRLLVALGFAHRAGVIHGAVLPTHVLIHAEQHGLVLVDWCYSVTDPGDVVPAMPARYADWYPPEVLRREPPRPGTDIYLATRCMTHVMGPRAPTALRRFARGCTLAKPGGRPQDAWSLLAELDEVLEARYGPRDYRPFRMPETDQEESHGKW